MNVPVWAAELATAFWNEAGETEPFPRNLRRPIAQAVPLSVVSLSRLTVVAITDWLSENRITCELASGDRPLRGCLVARHGFAFAFVDGADTEAEQRFSLAHELAHFLRDYWHVRRQVEHRVGAPALEALDGKRPATVDERLHALLRKTTVGLCVHLMDRDWEGNLVTNAAATAEDCADQLAYELLAPAAHVARHVRGGKATLVAALEQDYGLPKAQAARYAERLLPTPHVHPFIHRLQVSSGS